MAANHCEVIMGPLYRGLKQLGERPRNRVVYPVIASILAFTTGAWQMHLLLYYILPRFSTLVAAQGEAFPLPVRIAIAAFGGSAAWLAIAAPLSLCAGVWIGLFWKPNRLYGPNIVLTFCLVALLLIQLVFLLMLFQISDILSR
jgi:hypothetical protein